ncbi:MAG: MFS transporter [Acidobacteria bacterium]|nr:MFS transporter [Acidobacteriota bacterium]
MAEAIAPTQQTLETMPPVYRQVRWWILALLFFVTVINFVDRLTLSFVAPILRDTFKLSNQDYGFIVSSFVAGMLVGEFPMGWLMDRRGARFGLSFAVIWWSIANVLHAVGQSKWQFSALRFWMGTGECGNYSGGVKVVGQWFPPKERALAIGIFNGASLIAGIITPPLVVFITLKLGWQAAFLIPGLIGMCWVVFWNRFYRAPEQHTQLTEAERRYISEGRVAETSATLTSFQLLKLPQTWGLMLCRFLVGPVIQFYLFWLPEYLYRSRGLKYAAIGFVAALPPIFGDVGSIGGGWASGWLMKRGFTVTAARKAVMWLGAALCAMSVVVVLAKAPLVWGAALCAVYLGHYALSANMFASITDLIPTSATARVTSLTGIAGGLSGTLFPLLTGWLVDKVSFKPVFFLAALMPAAGVAALWLLATKKRPILEADLNA